MAAARSWEASFPPEVAASLGDSVELQIAIVEHKVRMPGIGYPSQCDVFALTRADGTDQAVAIEAKVNEPFGRTIGEWLGPSPSANKLERLGTICAWFGHSMPPLGLRYQLFHRTAAAIVEARRFHRPMAAMVVQSFSPGRMWFDDFATFSEWLTGLPLSDDHAETELPDGLRLRLAWAQGDSRYLEDIGT
ncbi:hypothetical protein FLO80_00870 [Aquicoccus porphyridii]|uniref:DUF6946 domain-containing protein n=1 Tax=Aquicoccus porphyridii TaxID=1852029 RepID=A0A5A9ZUC0_9RHOB|nr:hypothetical protein [Aquicoccus porphyridii]KAA0920759.1 hypothetical protein FLO80_00870 [Aquicoccus porphyridii]